MKLLKVLILVNIILALNIYGKNYKKYAVCDYFVEDVVNKPFPSLDIKHEKAKEVIERFLGKKYKVISVFQLGYYGSKVYFALQEFMPEKYYNAAKNGIIVKENGEIEGYLDINKGIYSKKRKLYDFKELGLKKGEVKFFILYNSNKEYFFQLIDKFDNNIVSSDSYCSSSFQFSSFILERQRNKNDDIVNIAVPGHINSKEKFLYEYRNKVKKYRQALLKGKSVKSAAVKKEFNRLLKIGLVQGASLIKKKSKSNDVPLKSSKINEINNKGRKNTLIYVIITALAVIIIIVLVKVIKKKELKTT